MCLQSYLIGFLELTYAEHVIEKEKKVFLTFTLGPDYIKTFWSESSHAFG
jgi:hypothetical protein